VGVASSIRNGLNQKNLPKGSLSALRNNQPTIGSLQIAEREDHSVGRCCQGLTGEGKKHIE
jgi:hypothetical protein